MNKNLKFGWHINSFPVDGSSAPAFTQQIKRSLDLAHDHFDSAWVDDHFWPWAKFQADETPYLECVSTIAYYAALYPKLMFGSSVFCQSYRNPALLAKTVANLQWLTGGRIIFGIGAGWMEEEYLANNYAFPKPAVRIAQLEEAIQVILALWRDTPASYQGNYYQIENSYCMPKPDPIPPLLIGGGGEQLTLRVVAKYADAWNLPGSTLAVYKRKLEILRGHCDAIGRNDADIMKTWSAEAIAVAKTEDEARRISQASPYQNGPIFGTPAQIAEQLQAFVDLGVEHFAMRFVDFPETTGMELFVQEVMPRLRGA